MSRAYSSSFDRKYAAQPDHVTREWRNTVGRRDVSRFIRPIFWRKSMPQPPTPIGHLHFEYLSGVDRFHRTAPRVPISFARLWQLAAVQAPIRPTVSAVAEENRVGVQ
jgi:hypothetical protein